MKISVGRLRLRKGGKAGHGRMLKKHSRSQPQPSFIGARDYLYAQYGIAAQLEEVVVDSNRRDPEKLLPNLGENSFAFRARPDIYLIHLLPVLFVRRQRPAVHLSI